MWQWIYFNDAFYPVIKNMVVPEVVFVFFPYVLRTYWPKTSFRDSLESTKAKTVENQFFYKVAIQVTKVFYIWAKHYIGIYLSNDQRVFSQLRALYGPSYSYPIEEHLLHGSFLQFRN